MGPLDSISVNMLEGKKARKQGVARKVLVNADVRCLEVVGRDVWTGDRGGVITVRKVRTGEAVLTIAPRCGVNVWCIRYVELPSEGMTRHGCGHVWTGMSNGAIVVYDSATRKELNHFCKHSGGIYQIVDHNKRVYSCSNDFEIFEWKASNHQFIRQFSGHKGYVRCILPTGPTLLSGSDDTTIRIWDVATGSPVHIVQHHTKSVHAMVRVGNHIWSAGGSVVIVWDLHTLQEVAHLTEHCAAVLTLCRVGTRVYSGGADQEIYAWDATTHRLVGSFTDHTGWVYTMCNTAKVVRYFMWSTSINDGCLQIWHHDEYHPMNSCAKDCENRVADLLTTNPEGRLAEHLQDTNENLQDRCKMLEHDLATNKMRVNILENELRHQNHALEQQMGVQHALSGVLSDVNTGQIPRLETTILAKDTELDKYAAVLKGKTNEVTTLKTTISEKDARIKELERKLTVLEMQVDVTEKAHTKHKQAHLKYIECNVDEVLKQAREREESLRSQTERLREQLSAALDLRRVRKIEDDMEVEAARALRAGRPTPDEFPHKEQDTKEAQSLSFSRPVKALRRSNTHAVLSPQRPAPPPGNPRGSRSRY